jgi:hypothetical protein
MKTSELTKLVKGLSKHYVVDKDGTLLYVNYKGNSVIRIHEKVQYSFVLLDLDTCRFHKLPYSNKLYMLVAEYAMTPLDERLDSPKKYYVKVPHTDDSYYWKFGNNKLHISFNLLSFTEEKQFTMKEIKKLGLEKYELMEVDHE